MAEFTQLPGDLNLTFVQGDQVKVNCDFDINITGYTVTNSIYITSVYAAGGGGSGFAPTHKPPSARPPPPAHRVASSTCFSRFAPW